MTTATETLILKESFEYCPYIRAMQKEKRRNASIEDGDKRLENEIDMDIPEAARLKAHLKRRVERQSKNKWVQYATEYASEIVLSDSIKRNEMRQYLDLVKDSVMQMNQKDHERKLLKKNQKIRSHEKHTF